MSDDRVNSQDELLLSEILQIRLDKLSKLKEENRDPFKISRFDRTSAAAEIHTNFDAMENQTVSLAGRIMSKRDMGKSFFCDILDYSGRIQLYIKVNDLGADSFSEFKKYDIGDIIGVTGFVFKTKKGEISVHCKDITLLSKSLKPLPEKYHGLRDSELRFRQRYVDLIVNTDVRQTFIKRSAIIKAIRTYLDKNGYLEVETPVLSTISGGANARPFVTHHNALNIDMYMRIATELHLKRLVVGGLERVYEIGRLFRNEGMDSKHNPEFTTVEFYEAYTDMEGMIQRTEDIFQLCAEAVLGENKKITYQGEEIDLTTPFERLTMIEAVKKYTGLDFQLIQTSEDARTAAETIGIKTEKNESWGEVLYKCFDERVENELLQPVFITMHPVEISPLAKRSADDLRLTERFELFITRREMANAFSELNDPIDQKERFVRQAALRAAGDEEASMMDDDYITALEYGLPPTGGCGIGIDRLTMLLTDCSSIREVILFPTMKPQYEDK